MYINIAIRPVLTFKTAKGSQYWMDRRGRSQRFKYYRPEHGFQDQGLQDMFHYVIFVDNYYASHLVAASMRYNNWRLFIRNRKVGILTLESNQSYKLVAGPFDFSYKPAIGYAPIEFHQLDYSSSLQGFIVNSRIHVGNEIISINYLSD